jgi:hypothetical protein
MLVFNDYNLAIRAMVLDEVVVELLLKITPLERDVVGSFRLKVSKR